MNRLPFPKKRAPNRTDGFWLGVLWDSRRKQDTKSAGRLWDSRIKETTSGLDGLSRARSASPHPPKLGSSGPWLDGATAILVELQEDPADGLQIRHRLASYDGSSPQGYCCKGLN